MEQRQQQVQVGAGLQESRLNTDLINFLQKYGSWAVYALLVVVLLYVGNNWWTQQKEKKLDAAFADLRSALASSNPASLLDVSTNHPGTTVAALGRIEATRLYLNAARMGLKPGANAASPAPEDKLDEAGRRSMTAEASKLVDAVLADADAPETVRQQARWFRASIQADAGEYDAAIATMEEVANKARAMGYPDQEAKARERVNTLAKLKSLKPLLSRADLPESAREPDTAAASASAAPAPIGPPDDAAGDPTMPRIINAPEGTGMRRLSKDEIEKLLKSGQVKPLNPDAPAQPQGSETTPPAAPEATPSAPSSSPPAASPPANPPANPPAEPKPN